MNLEEMRKQFGNGSNNAPAFLVENKIRKVIAVEVLASNEKVVGELMDYIEDANARNFDGGVIRVVKCKIN